MGKKASKATRIDEIARDAMYQVDCRDWRADVRKALYTEYHSRGVEEVSDNEVYELIFIKRKVPPPPARHDGERVGLARSSIFTERENPNNGGHYYEPTDKTTLSNDPVAKRRRIRIFRYLPEYDERASIRRRSTTDWVGSDGL